MIRKSLRTIFMAATLSASTLAGSPIDPVSPAQAQSGAAMSDRQMIEIASSATADEAVTKGLPSYLKVDFDKCKKKSPPVNGQLNLAEEFMTCISQSVTGEAHTFFAHVALSLIIVPSIAILAFVCRNKRDLTRKKELKKMTPTASPPLSAPDPLPEPPKEAFDHEAAKKVLREFRERQRSL